MKLFSNLKGDIAGGLTAGIISLPLSVAFGIASGLGAAAGIYCAIILTFFVSLVGGTKTQISGPTGPMTVVVASTVAALNQNLALIMSVFVIAGVMQMAFGALRLGKIVKFIPYPVISGFMCGIGVLIIIPQLAPFFGLSSFGGVVQTLLNLKTIFLNAEFSSFLIASFTLIILYFTPKNIGSKFPPALIALILMSIIVFTFNINTPIIGDIPMGLPKFAMPHFDYSQISIVLTYAFMLALLGSIDSLLTLVVTDSMLKIRQNPNRELIGQGLGNMMSGFFGGLVGASATMRTLINVKVGGRTPLSGVVSSLLLLVVLVAIGPFVKTIPMAALAGILIKVGFDIMDYRFLKRLPNAPTPDLIVAIIVFTLTVFVDLIVAVTAGVVASCVLLVYRIAKSANIHIEDDSSDLNRIKDNMRVITINGPFFFGSSTQILDRTTGLVDIKILLIDIATVPFVDLSAAYALEDMISSQKSRKVSVMMVMNAKQGMAKVLAGVVSLVGSDNIYLNKKEALIEATKRAKAIEQKEKKDEKDGEISEESHELESETYR